ncbi:MAG TPA: chorismate synthase [Chloroflexota bacterium]|nr:chorismate synthase [Chloroflexota bacterium]
MSLKALPFVTAGESHGQQLTIVIQNVPAGLELSAAQINEQLRRRQGGHGRGGRMKIEKDQVQFVAGVRYGYTMGSPIAMVIPNLDWPNWAGRMDVERPAEETPKVTKLRPGHADLAGIVKFAHDDVRNVLERASSRETASRVAAGAVARVFLAQFGIELRSHTVRIGPIEAQVPSRIRGEYRGPANPEIAAFWEQVESSDVRCGDAEATQCMKSEIDAARTAGDTLGGVFEVIAYNVPIGLGSYSQWDEKLDGRLAGALLSIPSIKGVEIGDGFAETARRGSTVHDVIEYDPQRGWSRRTNNAGGTEGGVTNGAPLVVRCAAKPISTLINPLPSVDLASKEESPAHVERSDVCVVPAAGVVGEAMVALVLADAFRQKFGGDSMAEIGRNFEAYVETYEVSSE